MKDNRKSGPLFSLDGWCLLIGFFIAWALRGQVNCDDLFSGNDKPVLDEETLADKIVILENKYGFLFTGESEHFFTESKNTLQDDC